MSTLTVPTVPDGWVLPPERVCKYPGCAQWGTYVYDLDFPDDRYCRAHRAPVVDGERVT